MKLNDDSSPLVVDDVQQLEKLLKDKGRVVQRKRERDQSYELDSSPSAEQASKINTNHRAHSRDPVVQLDAAARALNISSPLETATKMSGQNGSVGEMVLEHDNKID